jgi:membrane associated rhomboid family serine protease/antitoxin component YwqK of YwqJK toxin-antitoxin module
MVRRYPVTLLLLAANVLYFLYFVFQYKTLSFSSPESFLAIFWSAANFNPLTLDGDAWRLFTSMFMHWGIIHLAVNMYSLYQLGVALEETQGSWRLLILYLLTGIVGGIASLAWNVYVPSAGASGAVFGLYGFYILQLVLKHYQDRVALNSIIINFVIFAGVNYFVSRAVQVDNAAHLGGFFSGACMALLQYKDRSLIITCVVISMLSVSAFVLLPRDQVHYYKMYQSLVELENKRTDLSHQKLTDDQFADSLEVFIVQWENILHQLNDIPHLPEELHEDTVIIRGYITGRKSEDFFRKLLIQKESYVYLDSMEIVQEKLAALPKLKYLLNYQYKNAKEELPSDTSRTEWRTVKVFFDSNWVETEREDAPYFRIGQRDSAGAWQGFVRDYYADGLIQMKGKYLHGLHDGVFLYYSHDGHYESAGRYEKENAIGKWEYFHKNGKLHREVSYGNGAFTRNVYDTLGNLQVTNGEGHEITWHPNGQVQEEGDYHLGQKDGLWKGYHVDGRPYFEELYRNNRLLQGRAQDRQGNRYIYDHSTFYPYPSMPSAQYAQYVKDHLRREVSSRRISGVVKVGFTVDVDGTLRDFIIMESLNNACDTEAIRVLKDGPKWRPAMLHGYEKVRTPAYYDIIFEP